MTEEYADLVTDIKVDIEVFPHNLNHYIKMYLNTYDVYSEYFDVETENALVDTHLLYALKLIKFLIRENRRPDMPVLASDYVKDWRIMVTDQEIVSLKYYEEYCANFLFLVKAGEPSLWTGKQKTANFESLALAVMPVLRRFLSIAPFKKKFPGEIEHFRTLITYRLERIKEDRKYR